jgi:uncharacterized protein (TIGR00369 family)
MTHTNNIDRLRENIATGKSYPMAETMNFKLVSVGDGTATFEATPTARFINPWDRIHGGYAAALLDSALGTAVATKCELNVPFGTIDLKVSYVRRIEPDQGKLTCIATVLHAGRTMLTAEAKVLDANGKLCAHGTGTFLIYPNK